jgi:hypothetical protein
MRSRIFIFCGLVLGVCLWILLHRAPGPKPKAGASEVPAPQTNQFMASQSAPSAKATPMQNPAPSQPPPAIAAEAVRRGSPEGIKEMQQRALADWQRPIEFYGKVVDENTNPVTGASITFGWSESPTEEAARRATTTSDANGLFSLHGEHGPALDVWVAKEGYYASHGGQRGFSYLNGFSSDPMNPVIFLLRKKGTGENLIGVKQNYRVARDGTPLGINLTTGEAVTGGSGDFVVQCWTDDQGKPSGAKYDWRCLITIPSGGVVPTDEEFPFLAPENGYAPTNEIAMPTDSTNWTSDVDLKFYYRLADGRYGRMTFSMIAGGQHFCMIDSVLNPSGSRNLEPQ